MRERSLWRLLPYLRIHRRSIFFVVWSALASIAAALAIPLVVKAVIDGPISDGDKGAVLPLVGLAVVLGAVETALSSRRRVVLAELATDIETRMRVDLYAHLQRLDVGFHDQWQSGQLLSRATSDLSTIRRFAGFGSIFFVILSVEVLAVFALLISLHAMLGLLVMAVSVPVLALCRRFEREYFVIVRDIQDQTGDLTTTIEEGAKGIRVLKAFGRGEFAFEGYDERCRQLHQTQLGRIAMHTKFVWVLGAIPNLTLTAVLLAGALAVSAGTLSLGGLVAFVSYVLILVWPIEALGWILAMAEEAETAAGRVFEVLDTEPVIADDPGAASIERSEGRITFEAVGFRYPSGGGRTVLRRVDLTLEPGETVALVGATGSGKTTLATLLARLHDPTSGRITLDGADLRSLTVESLRRQIGFAFEEPTLFSASVRENLLMGAPEATDDDVEWALGVAQATFAHHLPWGLDTRIGEQGMSLSGGQRQRLALARAVIARPRILVLDDPLSALDVHTEEQVEQALRPVLAACTTLLVVHRPSTVALADRAALLDEGRIVATGTHHDLLESEPRYRSILSQTDTVPDREEVA